MSLHLFSHNGGILRDTLLARSRANETAIGVALTPTNNYVMGTCVDTYQPYNSAPEYSQPWFSCRNWDRRLPTRPSPPTPQNRLTAYPTTDAVTLAAANEYALHRTWALMDLLGRPVLTGTLLAWGTAASTWPGCLGDFINCAWLMPGQFLTRCCGWRSIDVREDGNYCAC